MAGESDYEMFMNPSNALIMKKSFQIIQCLSSLIPPIKWRI